MIQSNKLVTPLNRLGQVLNSNGIAVAVFLLMLLFHALTLMRYPEPWIDEGLTGSRAAEFHKTGSALGELDQRLAVLAAKGALESSMPVGPSFFFSLFIDGLPLELFEIRLVSIIFGAVLLLCSFFIGKAFANSALGVFFVIAVGSSTSFAFASHVGRSDILAFAVGYLGVCVFLWKGEKHPLFNLLAGFLVGAAFELHPRVSILGVGLAALYIHRYGRSTFRQISFWLYVAGGLAGLMIYGAIHIFPNYGIFVQGHEAFTAGRVPPGVGEAFSNIVFSFSQLLNRVSALRPWTIWLALALLPIWLVDRDHAGAAVITWLGATVLASILLMESKAVYNAIAFDPAIGFAVGYVVYSVCCKAWTWRKFQFYAASLFGGIFIVDAGTTLSRTALIESPCHRSFDSSIATLRNTIDKDELVMADETYWLGMQDYKFMTWKSLKTYEANRKGATLTEAFKFFRPDIFIIDGAVSFYIRNQPASETFTESLRMNGAEIESILQSHATHLGGFDTGCSGRLDVFKMKWD